MQLKTLIELLQKYTEDYEVFVCNEDGVYTNTFHIDNDQEGEIDLIGE